MIIQSGLTRDEELFGHFERFAGELARCVNCGNEESRTLAALRDALLPSSSPANCGRRLRSKLWGGMPDFDTPDNNGWLAVN